MDASSIIWDPLLPTNILIAMAVVGALVMLAGFLAPRPGIPAPGVIWRIAATAAILAALANPSIVVEDRTPLSDIGLVVVDRSQSQSIGARSEQADAALAHVSEWAAGQANFELRIVEAPTSGAPNGGEGPSGLRDGTHLYEALDRALIDIPLDRFAGAVLITDGRIHDLPENIAALDLGGPVHAMLTGDRAAGDRRLTIVENPGYGIVGDTVRLKLRIDEPAAVRARQAQITIRRDGAAEGRTILAPVGVDHSVELIVDRGGTSVFELSVGPGREELTLANNRAVVTVNGIRDRLRVLLVSGAPHPGERTWRNLLKADPSVDLVHFTILRPPEKQDGTPVRELSLIAFPYRELFEVKLNDFDLIIFDRYRRMGVLPPPRACTARRWPPFCPASRPAMSRRPPTSRTSTISDDGTRSPRPCPGSARTAMPPPTGGAGSAMSMRGPNQVPWSWTARKGGRSSFWIAWAKAGSLSS